MILDDLGGVSNGSRNRGGALWREHPKRAGDHRNFAKTKKSLSPQTPLSLGVIIIYIMARVRI